jgi:integrase/recombinase XerD
MQNFRGNNVLNIDNFTTQSGRAKSHISEVISQLVRSTNKHKLTYDQLRYILRIVRDKCGVKCPQKVKRLPQMPTIEELEVFYSSISNPVHNLIYKVLEGTGLRIRELTNLKVADIDFGNNTIFVKQGKGSKDRVAIMGNSLKDKLQIYLDGRNNTYLFESNRNTKFTTRRIQQLCTKYAKGITTPIHCHTFRHLFITNLADNNISREIREIVVGHAKGSKAHDVYMHLTVGNSNKEEIINILDKRK